MLYARLIYLSALAISVYLAYSKAGFISTMALYMLLLIAIVDGLLLLVSVLTFKIDHQLDKKRVNKQETILYDITIANRAPLLLAPLKIEYQGSEILFRDNVLDESTKVIYPFSTKTIIQSLYCKYRGTYQIGLKSLVFKSFFKLFCKRFKRIESHEITIYPKIYNFQKIKSKQPINQTIESLLCLDKFDKSNFSDVRQYQPGDPLNRIHWKLSAKSEQLITKQFEGNQNQSIMVFINNAKPSFGSEEQIVIEDLLIESTVALVKHYLDNSIKTELFWANSENDTTSLEGSTPGDFANHFRALTDMKFVSNKDFLYKLIRLETLKQSNRSNIVVFSTDLTQELIDQLITCKRSEYKVFLMLCKIPDKFFTDDKKGYDRRLLFPLLDNHIAVMMTHLEDDQCNLEVIS